MQVNHKAFKIYLSIGKDDEVRSLKFKFLGQGSQWESPQGSPEDYCIRHGCGFAPCINGDNIGPHKNMEIKWLAVTPKIY